MILAAPTSFKGTHSATAAAEAIARGARDVIDLEIRILPVSDGGPGLIEALSHSAGSEHYTVVVSGPLGAPVEARILVQSQLAIIESADACGLHLLPPADRDPLKTSTFGVGELIRRAAAYAPHVVVGVGGSATIDGGLGMAQALGWQLLDEAGNPIERGGEGVRTCFRLSRATENHELLTNTKITVLTDVANPLFGPRGAARIFGAQKGATPAVVEQLDAGLARVAGIIRRDLGVDVANMSGAGAAGGLAAGLHAFAGARLVRGSAWVLDRLGFDRLLEQTRIVITGEGAYDAQSSMGKITGEVIARAQQRGIPVLLIAGSIDGDVPVNVHAVAGGAHVEVHDIERLVRQELPRLLSQ